MFLFSYKKLFSELEQGLRIASNPSKLASFRLFFFSCSLKIFCPVFWLLHLQGVCPSALSESKGSGSWGALEPCDPVAKGTEHRGAALAQMTLKTKSAHSVVFARLMTPDPDTSLSYAWTSTRLPAPSLAIAAVVHRKFVKTHTIPQTPQFQEISIFLLKPVLLEIFQPSSAESHYFWNAFVNIYCRGFLNDNSHRLWLSLIWQFANLTPFCLLASWSKGKFFCVFQHHHCGLAAKYAAKCFLEMSLCLTQQYCGTQGIAHDSGKILSISSASFSYKYSV